MVFTACSRIVLFLVPFVLLSNDTVIVWSPVRNVASARSILPDNNDIDTDYYAFTTTAAAATTTTTNNNNRRSISKPETTKTTTTTATTTIVTTEAENTNKQDYFHEQQHQFEPFSGQHYRRTTDYPCNEILDSFSAEEGQEFLSDNFDSNLQPGSLFHVLVTSNFLGGTFGVQVRKLCMSCKDVTKHDSTAFSKFCSSDDFGYDVSFSGLVFIPLDATTMKVPTGTTRSMIFLRPTATDDVPTWLWDTTDLRIDLALLFAIATKGVHVVMPDFMGYGETVGTIPKGYLIRKSYETSVIPLWLGFRELIAEETDCISAIGDVVTCFGYSEGGYASLSVSDALHRMGMTLPFINASGAPFRFSSAQIVGLINLIDQGAFPVFQNFFLAIAGAAYSSTYPDVFNYGQGQDLLSDTYREELINLVHSDASAFDITSALPNEDILSVFPSNFNTFVRNAISSGITEPCLQDESILQANGVDIICQALMDNDLVDVLHTAMYPIDICHSPDDTAVVFENLPDFEFNPMYLNRILAEGDHSSAGEYCTFLALTKVISAEFLNYPMYDEHVTHNGGCKRIFRLREPPRDLYNSHRTVIRDSGAGDIDVYSLQNGQGD